MLRVSRYHFTAKNNLRLVQMTHLRLGIGSTRNYKTAHNKPAKTENPQQILIKTENRIQNHYLSQAVWITKIRKIFFWKLSYSSENLHREIITLHWTFKKLDEISSEDLIVTGTQNNWFHATWIDCWVFTVITCKGKDETTRRSLQH